MRYLISGDAPLYHSALPPISRFHLTMAFELVRRIFGQGKSSHSRTHEPTMENASLDDQQGETVHGIRDITNTAEVNWSELARATQDEWKGHRCYITITIITAFHRMCAVLAGLICTTSSVKPDNSRYFCSKRFKII